MAGIMQCAVYIPRHIDRNDIFVKWRCNRLRKRKIIAWFDCHWLLNQAFGARNATKRVYRGITLMEVMVKHTAQLHYGCISAHAGHSPSQLISQEQSWRGAASKSSEAIQTQHWWTRIRWGFISLPKSVSWWRRAFVCFGQGRGVEIIPSIGNPQFGEGMENRVHPS